MSIQPRITLYALISAIESDLRNLIKSNIQSPFLEGEKVLLKTKERYIKERRAEPNENSELIDFLDFGDTYQILLAKKDELTEDIRKELMKHRERLESIIPIRNRVMHSRPLEADDHYTVDEFVKQASKNVWPECKSILHRIQQETPDSFLNQVIPKTKIEERVCHNLPDSDFDETGFIGRKDDVRDIKKLLYGHHKIITLFGEGGVGKTALMLKIAYDIIDDDECPFEYVIWVTCKTSVLTSNGITEIGNAIKSFESMTQGIDEIFRNVPQTATVSEKIESILNSMREVKTLLILDNLETLQSEEEMMDFLLNCTEFGTVAITSRIGLGQLDYPRRIYPMAEKEAEKLLRDFARVLNVQVLYSLPKEKVQQYIKELFLNPLSIKWFVQAVASGSTPSEVLSNKGDILNYCLSNVYEKLNDEQKTFLHAILVNAKPTSKEELLFYTERKNDISTQNSLRKLTFTSFVRMIRNKDEWAYAITDFAREYVVKEDPPSEELYKGIRKKQDKVNGFRQSLKTLSKSLYHPRYIDVRKDSESFLAMQLNEALEDSREAGKCLRERESKEAKKLYEEAIKKVDEVQRTQPSYFEAYKISAFIYVGQRNYAAAEREYQKALEMAPEDPRVHYSYAGFLLKHVRDTEKAKEHAEKAFSIDRKSFDTRRFYARCIGFQGELDKAITIFKELFSEQHSLREKNMALMNIVDFYKRKVEYKKESEKDYPEAWRIFLEGIDFFEESRKEINPDGLVKKALVDLLLEGMQCTRNVEQRTNKIKELVSIHIDSIQKHEKGWRLENFLQSIT